MSKVENLISDLCPHGVPVYSLGEIGTTVSGLRGKSKDDFSDGNAPYVSYVEIFNNPGINFVPGKRVKVGAGENQSPIQLGDVLVTGSSETRNECGMTSVVTFQPELPIYLNSFCFIWRPNKDVELDPQFAKHLFRAQAFRDQVIETANGVTRQNISKPKFLDIEVPLPPLAVQHEIASILNKFIDLEAELEAELEARKTQYEYYRSDLLSFRDAESVGVRRVQLGDICEYRKERSNYSAGTFLYVGVQDLLQERRGVSGDARFVSSAGHDIFMPGDVLLGNIRPYLKKVWHADVEGRTNGDVLVVTPRKEASTELDTSYLYFLLSSDDFFGYCVQTSKGAKMPRGDKQAILRYEIPVPSIETQRRIVKVLTSFETLTQDLDIGLPAEISARRQQYEYYRNKLLTFKELEVA